MGYNLKSPWSLTELQNQNISNIPRELSQIIGHHSIDLNQGNSVSLEENLVEKLGGARNYLMESSSSGSSKRIRTPANGTIIPSCLVDGCTSDLSKGRDYHRRHKVCEIHSKTPKVYIKGQEQRFCQQCSRFHSLVEFDEGKRSCRKRLDGHNRRRRKPQPDSMSVNSSRLFPNQQGARYLHFGGSEIFSSSAASSGWAAAVKPDDEPMLYPNRSSLNFSSGKHIFSGSVSNSFRGTGKQFPFSQCSSSSLPEESVCQSILDASSTLGSSGNNQKMYSDGANQVIDSNCALSLLSSPPVETREIGLSHMVHPNLNTTSQSLIPTLNFSNLGMENGSVDSVLVSDGSSNPDLRGHNLFQIGPDGSSASNTHQTLSFSWE